MSATATDSQFIQLSPSDHPDKTVVVARKVALMSVTIKNMLEGARRRRGSPPSPPPLTLALLGPLSPHSLPPPFASRLW